MQGCPSSLIGDGPVTLSKGLSLLVSEHKPLRNQLESLFALCQKVDVEEEKATVFEDLVKEVDDFTTNLEFHSVREEDILFRMMEVHIGKNGGPIAVMEYEHEQANGYISKFLSNVKNGLKSDEEMVQNSDLVKEAYHTLVSHFMKEEQVLYPMAEKLFSDEEKEQLKQKITVNN